MPNYTKIFKLWTSYVANPRKCSASSVVSNTLRPNLSRLFSSGALSTECVQDSQENDDLKSRIFRVRLPKRSVTNVLQNWVSEGNQITLSELRHISKDLRKSQRYKHALEVGNFSLFFSFWFYVFCTVWYLYVWLPRDDGKAKAWNFRVVFFFFWVWIT